MAGIILIGFMGSGKSTVGRLLGEALEWETIDLDQEIEKNTGMKISEIFMIHGESFFRELEKECLNTFLKKEAVIATGGGIVLSPENRHLLQQHPTVVFLDADPELLIERIQQDQNNQRPLATSDAEIKLRYADRLEFYREASGIIVDTSVKTPAEVAEEIMEKAGKV